MLARKFSSSSLNNYKQPFEPPEPDRGGGLHGGKITNLADYYASMPQYVEGSYTLKHKLGKTRWDKRQKWQWDTLLEEQEANREMLQRKQQIYYEANLANYESKVAHGFEDAERQMLVIQAASAGYDGGDMANILIN